MKKNIFSSNHSKPDPIKKKLFNIIKTKRKNKRDKRRSNKFDKYENLKYKAQQNNIYEEKNNICRNNEINSQKNKKRKKSKISKINIALKRIKLNNDTYKRMESLFRKYNLFIEQINRKNISKKKQQNSDNNHSIFDLSNVILFVKNMYNNITTQRRRAEQLRQIIRLITGDEFLDFPEGYLNNMIMNYDKKIKIDYYIEEVFKQLKADDEKDAIVVFQFLFFLGLNIYQISKIKIKYFKMKDNDTLFLNLKYNGKKLQRKINSKTKINIELLINIGNLNDNDYIVFPYIKNLTNNSRYIYLYSYCSKKKNENKKLTFEIKEKFSMFLKIERKTKKYKFKSIDDSIIIKEIKKIFQRKKLL